MATHFKANEGYLNVALRILASQGWLECTIDNGKNEVRYRINANSEAAFTNSSALWVCCSATERIQKFFGMNPKNVPLRVFLT